MGSRSEEAHFLESVARDAAVRATKQQVAARFDGFDRSLERSVGIGVGVEAVAAIESVDIRLMDVGLTVRPGLESVAEVAEMAVP